MRCAPGSSARPWRPSSPRRSSPRWRGRSGSSGSRKMASRPVHVVSREVPPEFQLRMAVALGVVVVAFALVGVRLWYLQIERGAQMRYYSEKNRIRLVRVPAPRGVVYDRNGEILVDNRPSFDVVFVPEDAGERRRQVLKTLAGYLGEEEAGLHPGVHAAGSDRERYQASCTRGTSTGRGWSRSRRTSSTCPASRCGSRRNATIRSGRSARISSATSVR